ncbi:hypothetical protein GQ457_02G012850 [Hibiscus cannabinus]
MPSASPGNGKLPSSLLSRFFSPVITYSVPIREKLSVEVPFSSRWSFGLQTLHGLTSDDSKSVKARVHAQRKRMAKVKGQICPPTSVYSPTLLPLFQPPPHRSCILRPPLKPPFLTGYLWICALSASNLLLLVTDCLSSVKMAHTRIEPTNCLNFGSSMIRPIPTFERGACLLLELSPRSWLKLKICVLWSVMSRLFRLLFFGFVGLYSLFLAFELISPLPWPFWSFGCFAPGFFPGWFVVVVYLF